MSFGSFLHHPRRVLGNQQVIVIYKVIETHVFVIPGIPQKFERDERLSIHRQ